MVCSLQIVNHMPDPVDIISRTVRLQIIAMLNHVVTVVLYVLRLYADKVQRISLLEHVSKLLAIVRPFILPMAGLQWTRNPLGMVLERKHRDIKLTWLQKRVLQKVAIASLKAESSTWSVYCCKNPVS